MDEILTIIRTASITLPAVEVTLLLVLISFCLVFKLTRVGLAASYLFVYRWGWILFVERDEKFLTTYLVFGVAVGIVTMVGMVFSRH